MIRLFTRFVYFSILVFGIQFSTSSQVYDKPYVDSLRKVITLPINDSLLMDAHFKLSLQLSHTHPDSGIHHALEAMSYAEKANISSGKADAYSQIAFSFHKMDNLDSALYYWKLASGTYDNLNLKMNSASIWDNMGTQYIVKGQYDTAKYYLDKAKQVYVDLDTPTQHYILINYGVLYDYKGEYDLAMDYYHKAYKYVESRNDLYRMGLINNNISILYYYAKDCKKSLTYGYKSLKNWHEDVNRLNKASTYKNMAVCYEKLGNIDSSIYFNEKSLDLEIEIGSKWGQGQIHHNLGGLYSDEGQYQKALDHLLKAMEIKESFDLREGSHSTYIELAKLYARMGMFNEGIGYLNKGQKIVEETNIPENTKEFMLYASEFFELSGDYELALKYHKEYKKSQDTILNIQTIEAIEDIREKYEAEKRDQQIIILEQEQGLKAATISKQRSYLIGTILGLGGLLFGLYYLFQRNKKEKELFTQNVEALKRENYSLYEKVQQVKSTKQKVMLSQDDAIKLSELGISIPLNQLAFVLSDGNYILLHVHGTLKPIMIRHSLTRFHQELLPSSVFIRVNKSTVINLNFIQSKSAQKVSIRFNEDLKEITIGRPYKEEFRESYDTIPDYS